MQRHGEELFPAAQVQQYEEAYGAIMKRAGAINSEITRTDKDNIRRFLEMGRKLLQARPMANDDWEETLKEHGISSQRASDAMWGASQPLEEQAKWESIADLRRARAEQSAPKQSPIPPRGDAAPTPSTNPAAGLLAPPQEPVNKCPRCKSRGWTPNCEECAKLNKDGKPKPIAGKLCKECKAAGQYRFGCEACRVLNGGKPNPPPREAGDEDEPKAVVSWRKKIEKAISGLRTQLNGLAKMHGIAYQDGKGGKPAHFEHPLLQKAFSLYLQAKEAALKAEWQLRKEADNGTVPE